jgi:hypothetical protein
MNGFCPTSTPIYGASVVRYNPPRANKSFLLLVEHSSQLACLCLVGSFQDQFDDHLRHWIEVPVRRTNAGIRKRIFMKTLYLSAILTLALTMPATRAFAQDNSTLESDIQVLRSDLRAQKTQIVSDQLKLSDSEAKAFWPIYREYDVELSKLGDEKVAIIKEYAKDYDTITDAQIQDLAQRTFKLESKRIDLREKYFKKISKAVSPKTAARFMQVDSRLDLLMNLQLADSIPMVANK